MTVFNTRLIKLALNALYKTRMYRLFDPTWSGMGTIFTLHHVGNAAHRGAFCPNRILEVTPKFLDKTIKHVLEHNYEIVTLDEVRRRVLGGDSPKKFVCFTIDDGYADTFYNAYPLFKKYNAPFALYVNTGIPDGTAILWWRLLEEIVRAQDELEVMLDGKRYHFVTRSARQKDSAFSAMYWKLRGSSNKTQREALNELWHRYDVDPSAFCLSHGIRWDMIKEMADSGLATIGAHTVNHFALSKLTAQEIRDEAVCSRDIISARIGHTPQHFCYPYGDSSSAGVREFGIVQDLDFATATTTRKGLVFREHVKHLHALPRVSLNGEYQDLRYIELFLSGAPFALWRQFKRLDVN